MKCDLKNFHAQVGLVRIRQKQIGTRYAELVFFNLVEFAGCVVHSGASVARNVIAIIFMLKWD
jgi:hypothetical protein